MGPVVHGKNLKVGTAINEYGQLFPTVGFAKDWGTRYPKKNSLHRSIGINFIKSNSIDEVSLQGKVSPTRYLSHFPITKNFTFIPYIHGSATYRWVSFSDIGQRQGTIFSSGVGTYMNFFQKGRLRTVPEINVSYIFGNDRLIFTDNKFIFDFKVAFFLRKKLKRRVNVQPIEEQKTD